MITTPELLDPGADGLLHVLRHQVDDAMLREIAAADYGHDQETHFAALRSIRDTGVIAVPLGLEREVLQLIRWSEPEDPEWKPGGVGARGHLMRAFACAVLLRGAAEPAEAPYADGENQTLAQLLDSVLRLEDEVQSSAQTFLAWRADRAEAGLERPFFRLAELVLAVHLRLPASRLRRVALLVVEDEAAERAALGLCIADPRWLLGLTFHQLRHPVWVRLAHQVLQESERITDADARAAVQEVALTVLCG